LKKFLSRLSFLKFDPHGPWPLIGRLFREAGKKHTGGYIIATIFMVLVAGTTALSAWILRDVVDQVFVDRDLATLTFLVGGVVVISLVRGIALYGSTVTLTRVGNAIVAEMQMRVFRHLLDLGMNYYDRTHSSELIAAMSVRARAAGEVLNTVLTSFGRDLLSVIGLVTVMIIQSPWMSLIVLVIAPIAIVGVNRLLRQMRDVAKAEFQGMSQIISAMQETAQGIRIVKAFNLESAMMSRMGEAVDSVRKRSDKVGAIKARTSPLMETLGGFAIAGVMLWAGYETIYSGTKPGAFVSFIAAILLAYEPAKRLANTRVGIERSVAGIKFLYKILDTKPSMDPNLDGPDLKVERGDVLFKKVTFAYRRNPPVLQDFNFHAPAGKVTALVGPSGSGKSTIMALIERYYDAASGKIQIDGQDIHKVRLASLRDQIALVSQDTVIFRASVRENLRFGRPSATDAEVEQAAKDAMAHDFIMETKQGYDTELEEGGAQLSGGQRQRIAIARAMLRDAPIILLDEATSSLDSESENQVQVAFDRLMAGRTTIVIAHRLSTVLGADQICVLVRGQVVETGRHAELIAAGKHYSRLYYLQFEKHAANDAGEPEDAKVALLG
jgi:ATP-binding cassette subfamily B protein